MKLIFNPFYDQSLYTGRNEECSLREKYVGPLGLLNELELRAGLSMLCPSQTTRIFNYCEALSLCGRNSSDPDSLFYWKSFGVDMLNVSRRLLEWRDALVYAGMKDIGSIPKGISAGAGKILSDILDVEEYFNDESSTGDRWMRLAKESAYLPSDWIIDVRMKEELVDLVIKDCLMKSGATCRFVSELPEISHAVTVKKFSNLVDGYQWALTQEGLQDSVFVNKDNVSLNGVLTSLGKATVKAEATEAYTQISQLFSSGMKLFINPVDYNALVSYLAVPVHPLNEYLVSENRTLRHALYSHLLSQGGFGRNDRSGMDWNDIIAQASQEDGRMTVLPLDCCLGQWDKGATLSAIETYCSKWSNWCAKKAAKASDNVISQQLLTIKDSFDVLPRFLKLTGKDRFTEKELMVNIASATAFCTYQTHDSEVGSVDIVNDMKAIAEPCEKVVWMDCYDQGMSNYQYSFFKETDIEKMNEAGMMIPRYETQLQAEAVARHLAYSFVKEELVVLTPEMVECRKSYPQQIPHWDGTIDDSMTAWAPKGREIEMVDANMQQPVHKVTSSIFKGHDKTETGEMGEGDEEKGMIKRDYESFGSLDLLFNKPFDYVLQYLLNCRETSRNNLSTVKGNVVHKMFNNAVVESGKDWSKVKNALVDNFDESFSKAVNEVGIELLSLENRLTYNTFRDIIKGYAISSFVKIVEENGLSIVDSEADFFVDFDAIGRFNAKVDMILRNPAGKYVIMDFKWTDSKDRKREDEIRNNMEMQLALYAQAVRQYFGKGDESSVEAIGYFMLRQGVFITEYQGLKKCDEVRVVHKKETDSIFARAKESYDMRMKQFEGVDNVSEIEEGDSIYASNIILKGMLE